MSNNAAATQLETHLKQAMHQQLQLGHRFCELTHEGTNNGVNVASYLVSFNRVLQKLQPVASDARSFTFSALGSTGIEPEAIKVFSYRVDIKDDGSLYAETGHQYALSDKTNNPIYSDLSPQFGDEYIRPFSNKLYHFDYDAVWEHMYHGLYDCLASVIPEHIHGRDTKIHKSPKETPMIMRDIIRLQSRKNDFVMIALLKQLDPEVVSILRVAKVPFSVGAYNWILKASSELRSAIKANPMVTYLHSVCLGIENPLGFEFKDREILQDPKHIPNKAFRHMGVYLMYAITDHDLNLDVLGKLPFETENWAEQESGLSDFSSAFTDFNPHQTVKNCREKLIQCMTRIRSRYMQQKHHERRPTIMGGV